MKIHLDNHQSWILASGSCGTYLQPLRPATPFICPIPHARIPPNAPAIDAAEKNRATRY
jgi:hypothetical protein